MKRNLSIVFTLCIAVLLLSGCRLMPESNDSSTVVTAKPTSTFVIATPTPTAEGTPTLSATVAPALTAAPEPEATSVPPDPYGVTDYIPVYREVLDNYWLALTDEDDLSLFYTLFHDLGVSLLSRNFYGQDALQKLGYSLTDLNGDGRPELIIGSVERDEFYDNILFDAYWLFPATGHWGPPIKLAESMERDRWYYLDTGSGAKYLLEEGSGGASYDSWTLWKMDSDESTRPIFVQGIIRIESSWFTARLKDGEIVADQPISEQEAAKSLSLFETSKTQLTFTPFAEYTPSEQYTNITHDSNLENGTYSDDMGSQLILYRISDSVYYVSFGVYKISGFYLTIGDYDPDSGILRFTADDGYGKSVTAEIRAEGDRLVVTILDWDFEEYLPNGTELVFVKQK